MEILNKNQKIILIIIVMLILLFIGYYITTKVSNSGYTNLETEEIESTEENEINSEEEKLEEQYIMVHVTGAEKTRYSRVRRRK